MAVLLVAVTARGDRHRHHARDEAEPRRPARRRASRVARQDRRCVARRTGDDEGGPGFDPFRDILRRTRAPSSLSCREERPGRRRPVGGRRARAGRRRAAVGATSSTRSTTTCPTPSTNPSRCRLPDLGSYRIVCHEGDGGWIVVGLPTAGVSRTISDLVRLELLATLLGVLAAAGIGTWVVRRQVAPLREVAATAHRVSELPLASGEIEMAERVPDRLADERTEIGQVGAALNAMLDHVEASLDQRHRSEQQVRQFVADASHELRTPLATIAGYTELARRRPGDHRHRARQGGDRVGADDRPRRGPAPAGPPRRRPPARAHARRPVPAAARGGQRRARGRPRPPVAAVPARRAAQRRRRRGAAAPGRHQPADQRPQVHPRRQHRHRDRDDRRASPSTTTDRASRPTSPRAPSSASSAATPPAPAPAAPASASPWSRRSSPPTAARSPSPPAPATPPSPSTSRPDGPRARAHASGRRLVEIGHGARDPDPRRDDEVGRPAALGVRRDPPRRRRARRVARLPAGHASTPRPGLEFALPGRLRHAGDA